jgi:hypothetical protein
MVDWAKHFQAISGDGAQFGTLLGSHTAHELSVDMTNWQGFVNDMTNHVKQTGSQWQSVDPSGWTDWNNAWNDFLRSWEHAFSVATGVVTNAQSSMLGWDYTTVESDYQKLLQTYQNGTYPSPGGFDDLYRRWVSAKKAPIPKIGKAAIDPNLAPDADLKGYQAADTALKAVEKVNPFANMPLWEKLLWAAGGLLGLGIVIKVAK